MGAFMGDDEEDDAGDVRIRRRRQPPIKNLHDEMTVTDVVAALQHVDFVNGFGLIRLDRHVRDFIVRALRNR